MTKIKNTRELRAEITRLEANIRSKEEKFHENFQELKTSFKPSSILACAKEETHHGPLFKRKKITWELVKTGLSLLLNSMVSKAESKLEQQVYNAVDNAFEKLKKFLNRKTETRKAKTYYRPEDYADSEED